MDALLPGAKAGENKHSPKILWYKLSYKCQVLFNLANRKQIFRMWQFLSNSTIVVRWQQKQKLSSPHPLFTKTYFYNLLSKQKNLPIFLGALKKRLKSATINFCRPKNGKKRERFSDWVTKRNLGGDRTNESRVSWLKDILVGSLLDCFWERLWRQVKLLLFSAMNIEKYRYAGCDVILQE